MVFMPSPWSSVFTVSEIRVDERYTVLKAGQPLLRFHQGVCICVKADEPCTR